MTNCIPYFCHLSIIKMTDFQHLTNHNAEFKDDKIMKDMSIYFDRF